jgi:NAD(P)-dependent dehydrogenase (short-subunit alcohol dehydrogenase family)
MPATDLNVLITGGNTGIGLATAEALAQRGARVFIACRDPARARSAADGVRARTGAALELLPLDLAELASVRACAREFAGRGLPLHVLINNAGLAGRGLTRDGFEVSFGTNHLGHFLLTQLLRPQLMAAGRARVVTVASKSHYDARGIDWPALQRPTRSITGLPEYQVSKLANVLFSAELARRWADTGVTTYSLHPGVVASEAWRRVPQPVRWLIMRKMISVEQGAQTSLYCATAPELAADSGKYYDECRAREPSALAQDPALAAELWCRSEAWVGLASG